MTNSQRDLMALVPGQSLGPLCTYLLHHLQDGRGTDRLTASTDLGASVHDILHIIKANECFSQIDFIYDAKDPTISPMVVSLPQNGFRMRFDGPDQRLRLIEVTDFTMIRLSYKGSELLRDYDTKGPLFKRIYKLFGASYPGEYVPPKDGRGRGRYALSWAGIAFDFPLQHTAWAPEKDHVSMLGSSSAEPAVSLAIFEGDSWPEVRHTLFKKPVSGPRSSAMTTHPKDNLPTELEIAHVHGDGRVEFVRRPPAKPFTIMLNQTTVQDLVTELGAPDTTHKRSTDDHPKEQPVHHRTTSFTNGRAHTGSLPSSYSSTGTDTFDADFDSGDAEEDPGDRATREVFWCYFNHGMDILVGPPREDNFTVAHNSTPLGTSPHLVVLKIVIHGNVPGSYAFNRHRRLRWALALPSHPYIGTSSLNSETPFTSNISGSTTLRDTLMHVFKDVWPESEMGRGKVVNRTWGGGGGGMSDSSFFLPDAERELVEAGGSEQWLGNTKLFAFPGLGFEVLDSGAVAALTIY